jgi:hypothetical protein
MVTKEHIKGLIVRDLLQALVHSDNIKDKEQFICDFDELVEML